MTPDPAVTLAMTAATTIVAAMATSSWQATKTAIGNLFRRHDSAQQDVEVRLDNSAARLADAVSPDTVRVAQVTRWREDIEDFLRDHPDAEGDLWALVQEIQRDLPPPQQQWFQHIEARGGLAVGAQGPGSNVIVHTNASYGQLPIPESADHENPASENA